MTIQEALSPMKRILLLTTGGTIASRLTDEGLAPGGEQ